MKKYKLTKEKALFEGKLLYRIIALVDIPNRGVKTGDLGGFVESEDNLSHKGDCWIAEGAKVFEYARVSGNALVGGLYSNVVIRGKARIYNNANVSYNARICDKARIYDNARIGGNSRIGGKANVGGKARIIGNTIVSGNAMIGGASVVDGDSEVGGDSKIFKTAKVGGKAIVRGQSIVTKPSECINFVNLKDGITITKKHITFRCLTYDIPFFKKNIKSLCLGYGYSKEEVKHTTLLIKSALALRKEIK